MHSNHRTVWMCVRESVGVCVCDLPMAMSVALHIHVHVYPFDERFSYSMVGFLWCCVLIFCCSNRYSVLWRWSHWNRRQIVDVFLNSRACDGTVNRTTPVYDAFPGEQNSITVIAMCMQCETTGGVRPYWGSQLRTVVCILFRPWLNG